MFKNKKLIIIPILLMLAVFIYMFDSITFTYRGANLSSILTELDSERYGSEVCEMLNNMTLEEKVGQMFMGCFYDGTPDASAVNKYNLGSVLLFGRSFENTTSSQFKKKLEKINAAAHIKPIIAVDEEGGTVNRVSRSKNFCSKPFRSPRELYAIGGTELIVSDVHEKNALLSRLGITLNLAPVCDISRNPKDFMYYRSLGENADVTAEYAAAVVSACLEDGMGCTLKHFPGYGNSSDTHKGIAIDNRSLHKLESSDLLPFKSGIAAGAPSVLVSHNIVTALDGRLPASLSPAVHKLLRNDLGFDGVIITDDMSMDAIDNYFPDTDSAVMAVLAGNDMLCTGKYAAQYEALLSAVKNGKISESRIDMSVKRILSWKVELGLIDTEDYKK